MVVVVVVVASYRVTVTVSVNLIECPGMEVLVEGGVGVVFSENNCR